MHRNKFIKRFAAESFTYVLRKVKKENLVKIVNSVCLHPLQKPYKYISEQAAEILENSINLENLEEPGSFLYCEDELESEQFCGFEKGLRKQLGEYRFVRKSEAEEKEYEYTLDQKISLLTTVSTIFSEAAYGVQFKLYTDWKIFVDIL